MYLHRILNWTLVFFHCSYEALKCSVVLGDI